MKEFVMFNVVYTHKGNGFIQNFLNVNLKISLCCNHLPRNRNPRTHLFFENMLVFSLNS